MEKSYFKFLLFGIVCLTFSLSQSQNILTDGEFSSTNEIIIFDSPTPPINQWAYWVNYWGNGSDANPTVVDGVCNFEIIYAGTNTWDVQLVQWGFQLEPGHAYQLSFDVKADANRSFGVFLGEDGGNYTNLIGYDRYLYDATTEWQNITIEFEAFAIFPLHKLSFELGADATTTYFDNIVLLDLGMQVHSVGIIGSAVNGWEEDVDMETEDGLFYTLEEYYFNWGEAKFRQDNTWTTNWGGDTFPTGTAFFNGPNIPVVEGTYTVTFNRTSGEYNFVATTCPNPELQCLDDIYVENVMGMCGAYVTYPEVIPAVNCGGDGITITQTEGLESGAFFPLGTTTNTFVLTNSSGAEAICSFNVTVFDIEPPVIADLNEIYEPLWPANHKMVEVFIPYVALDNCGNTTVELKVTSNEPENGLGDGDKAPDWEIMDEHHVFLRAERSGKGDGRIYYITIKAWDGSGNYSERQVQVKVPHDQSVVKDFKDYNVKGKGFKLYPNAAETTIHIKELNSVKNASYSIYDMFGAIQKKGILKNDNIDVSTLKHGFYILKFETQEGQFLKKFIKN